MWGGGGKLHPVISQLPDEIEAFNGNPPFPTTAIPMELTVILPDVTGSRKTKIAAYKGVLSIRLVDKIGRPFQRQTLHLRCPVKL
jgi:hypothetical protein